MTSFACIFVPDFPVEAILRAEPELRSQAVAVLEGKPPLEKVFRVNEEARRAGIEPGMSKIQIEACGGITLRPRSILQEAAAHAALLDCAQSFSPVVEDAASDTVLLDLAGLAPLFGSLTKIGRDLARRACDLGLEANVAVAANAPAAMLAARGFAGVTVIAEGKEAEQLGSLPVEVLCRGLTDFGVKEDGDEFLERLERWGVRTLRALASLPDLAIAERLGQNGVQVQRLARGTASRTLVPVEMPMIFEEAAELEQPLVLLEPLAFLLGRLLDQLCARLSARALATQELRLKLELDNSVQCETDWVGSGFAAPDRGHTPQIFQRNLRLPVPLLDSRIFLKLLQLDLKTHPPGAPIVKIHLAAEPVRPRAAQGGLFVPPSPEPEKLELTLMRIAGIVGENRAGSLEILDTHRPGGFLMRHFRPREPEERKSGGEAAQCLVMALRIFRPPIRAVVTLRDGRPGRMLCPKQQTIQGEVLWTAGPWRSSGDWWEQHGWARDEWDVAVQQKSSIALYRLVRDLLSGQWLVEGGYD